VTYAVIEGKNIAKLVAVEREEETPAAPVTPARRPTWATNRRPYTYVEVKSVL